MEPLSEPLRIPGAYPQDTMEEAKNTQRYSTPSPPVSTPSGSGTPELLRSDSPTPEGSPSSTTRRPSFDWVSSTLLRPNSLQPKTDKRGVGEGKNDDLIPGLGPSLPCVVHGDNRVPNPLAGTATPETTRHQSSPLDEELPEDLASRSDESWRVIEPTREHRTLESPASNGHDNPPVVTRLSGTFSMVSSWCVSLFDALWQLITTKISFTHEAAPGSGIPSSPWEGNDADLQTWMDAQLSVSEGHVSEDMELDRSREEEKAMSTTELNHAPGEGETVATGNGNSTGGKEPLPANRDIVVIEESRAPDTIRGRVEDDKFLKLETKPDSVAQPPQSPVEHHKVIPNANLKPKNPVQGVTSNTGSKAAVSVTQPSPSAKPTATHKKKGTECQQAPQPGKPKPAQTAKAKNPLSPAQAPAPVERSPVVKKTAKAKTPAKPPKTPVPAQKGMQGGAKSKKGVAQQAPPPKKAPAPPPSAPPPKALPPPKPSPVPPPPKHIPQFTGKVIIEPQKPAILFATLANGNPPCPPFGPDHLTLYSDASWSHANPAPKAGMAVVHRLHPTSPWTETAYTISASRRGRQNYCEILAIEAALGIALKTRKAAGSAITRVTVFSDAQPALDAIAKARRAHTDLFARGAAYSAALAEMGVAVELRWVPGHSGVEGNKRADTVAGLARVYGPDPTQKGVVPEEPTVMRLSVAVLRGFSGVLGATRGLMGAKVQKGVEAEVGRWFWRAAKEEGWVLDLNVKAKGFD